METTMRAKSSRRILEGVVISDKMQKTITVKVTRTVRHKKYNKFVKKHASYHAHDESDQCKQGDVVTIVESNPRSKTKRWCLASIVEKAE